MAGFRSQFQIRIFPRDAQHRKARLFPFRLFREEVLMKWLWMVSILFLSCGFINFQSGAADGSPARVSTRVIELGKSFTVMESTRPGTNQAGQLISKTNRYTTIGNGMNFRDASGNWAESKPVVQSFSEGIVCSGASYRAIISTNLRTAGAIDLQTGDGRIVSHPLGIGFFDPASGRSVLLAQVKDCLAEVVSNKIIFRDAFEGSGIKAAVVYTYGVGRFHQDVTFVKRPAVTPADFGLGSKTRLELMTEIVQSPAPEVTEHVLKAETNAALRAGMVEPDVVDQTLKFGEMIMPLGRAFLNGTAAPIQRGLPVAKRLLNIDGRTVLTESLEWTAAKAELDQLPLASVSGTKTKDVAAINRQLPARRVAQRVQSFETRLAEITRSRSIALAGLDARQSGRNSGLKTHESPLGFVMDYELMESIDGFTFLSGTYYLPSAVSIHSCSFYSYSQIIFKYGHFSSLNLSGSIGSYSGYTNIFTSVDDDTIGDTIEGSTGSPDGYYAAYALGIEGPYDETVNFDALDFRYAYGGLHVDNAEGYYVSVGLCSFTNTSLGVDAGSVAQIGLTEVRACHVGTLYQEDNGGTVVIGSVVTCPDSDGDGLPDAWEINNFGNLNQTANGDYDGDGFSNLQEFENGTEPNTVSFWLSVTNLYANASSACVQVHVIGGVPAGQAVLVDSTNVATASWTTYSSSNLPVNLGAVEGWHTIRVGLRGRTGSSQQLWRSTRIKLDSTPPILAITHPSVTTISQPLIQLQGYSSEAVSRITYDLTNATGWITNQPALVLDQYCDTNLWELTTNYFQAFDLELSEGTNTITLHAWDRAGNLTTTNFSLTLDLTNDHTAPVINLFWPQSGMKISGTSITWRGFVDDPTAVITVAVTGTNALTNVVTAVVEREGTFWAENVPLEEGTNFLTLSAVDTARNAASTNITIVNLPAALTFAPLTGSLTEGATDVGGYATGLSGYTIWVNGVMATQAYGMWNAHAPLNPGGTAVIQATAIPNSDYGGNGFGGGGGQNPQSPGAIIAELEQDRSSFIYVASYEGSYREADENSDEVGWGSDTITAETSYRHPVETNDPGNGNYHFEWTVGTYGVGTWGEHWDYDYVWPRSWPFTTLNWTYDYWEDPGTNDYSLAWPEAPARPYRGLGPIEPWSLNYYGLDYDSLVATTWHEQQNHGDWSPPPWIPQFTRDVTSQLKLWTGGKSVAGHKALFRLSASATQWEPFLVPDIDGYLGEDWTNETLLVRPPLGEPSDDGNNYAVLPEGKAFDMMPQASAQYLTAGADQAKFVLKIKQGNTDLTDKTTNVIEGQEITLDCVLQSVDGSDAPAVTSYQWQVDDIAVAGYSADLNSAIVDTNIVKTNSRVTFYWANGGSKRVSCSVKVGGLDYPKVKTTFKVVRPSADLIGDTCGNVEFGTNPAQNALACACGPPPSYPDPGMTNVTSDPNTYGFGGSFTKTQIILNYSLIFTNSVGAAVTFITNGLDNDIVEVSKNPLFDAPNLIWLKSLGWRGVFVTESFRTVLMFRPSGPSISVPIKEVLWNWSGRAYLDTNGIMTKVANDCFLEITVNNGGTLDFPRWTNRVINTQ
jgi:hypothetical protein